MMTNDPTYRRGPPILGWCFPPYVMAGCEREEAMGEACSVVDPLHCIYFQEHTRSFFVLGEELFATVEPHGRLFRCRYSRYPDTLQAFVESLKGVEIAFAT